MLVPSRYGSNDSYRYGFNGKEYDDELKGEGNSIHYEFREFDPRIGRFSRIDPKASEYSWQTPYAYHRNNPVNSIDYLGLGDPDPVTTTAYHNTTVESAGNIVKDGTFKSGKSGWNYFMTDATGTKAGSEVAKSPVQIKVEINMSGANEISYKQWGGFFDEAKVQLGLEDVANGDLTKPQLKQLNAIRNQKAVSYMNSIEGADSFVIHAEKGSSGQKFLALKDNSVLSRVSSKMQTTRGGQFLANRLIPSSLRGGARLLTLGKALLRITDETVLIESTIMAMQEHHKANQEYTKEKRKEGKTFMTDTYSDVGLFYWLSGK